MNKPVLVFLISVAFQSNSAPVSRNDDILNDLMNVDSYLMAAYFPRLLSSLDQEGYNLLTHGTSDSYEASYNGAMQEFADIYPQLNSRNQVMFPYGNYEINF